MQAVFLIGLHQYCGGEDLGHGHLRLLSLLLEQLLQQLDLVSGGQRRPRAQARGL